MLISTVEVIKMNVGKDREKEEVLAGIFMFLRRRVDAQPAGNKTQEQNDRQTSSRHVHVAILEGGLDHPTMDALDPTCPNLG